MHFDLSFDPFEILGVSSTDSLESLREAYRLKARRHHPDGGGESWSFRVVKKAYEVLSAARVLSRAAEEFSGDRSKSRFATQDPEPASAASASQASPFFTLDRDADRVRPGVRDKLDDPAKLVDVELFVVRFELGDAVELLTLSAEERNLSCSLHINWPSHEWLELHPSKTPDATLSLVVVESFDALSTQLHSSTARSKPCPDRFCGWFSFPTVAKASEAVKILRTLLHDRGLGLVQTIRETTVARST